MDPEREKRLAALIMEEAKRLRMRADREGVHAYLEKPNLRGRPNSQFLTATVRSVQQANRMAEINEMWRLREKELELEKCMHSHKYPSEHHRSSKLESSRHNEYGRNSKHIACTSSKDVDGDRNDFSDSENADSPKMSELSEKHPQYSAKRKKGQRDEMDSVESGDSFHDNEISGSLGDEGLLDEEVDDFLRSRTKRGRGSVGSRMDETGPYLMSNEEKSSPKILSDMRLKEDWEQRIIGPIMPPFTKADGCVGGLEKLNRDKYKHEERRDRAKLKMHEDTDGEIRLKKSKKTHEKRNKLEKKKQKKEKRKKKRRDG